MACPDVLERLMNRPVLVPCDALPSVLGLDPADAAVAVEELVGDGWLERWTFGDEAVVTLTPAGAEVLDVEIESRDPDRLSFDRCRWVARGAGKPGRRAPSHVGCLLESELADTGLDEPEGAFDRLVDRRALDPVSAVAIGEVIERFTTRTRTGRPRPIHGARPWHLVGLDVAWPPTALEDGRCPGCLDRRWRRPGTFCLACGRWWGEVYDCRPCLDAPAPPPGSARADGLAGGTGPAKPRPARRRIGRPPKAKTESKPPKRKRGEMLPPEQRRNSFDLKARRAQLDAARPPVA